MSLIRQLWLLLAAVLLLALVASVGVSVEAMRATLQTQLRLKNSDNAQSLALALSQQRGDRKLMELVLSAQYDTGFYRRIRFVPDDGEGGFARESQMPPAHAPRWFAALAPIESVPGVAQVSDGWRALGSVEVVSHTTYVEDSLWRSTLSTLSFLAAIGVLAMLGAAWLVAGLRRPLEATVAQANALMEGRFERVNEPAVPELARVAQAMNAMVGRVRAMFEAQTSQVEALRQQAQCDALTGLSHRQHFLSQLQSLLSREDAAREGGVVLLRVADLAVLNQVLGHATTDRVLQAVAHVLRTYPSASGCFSGRLNGADFALCLPVAAVAQETAQSLAQALKATLPGHGPGIRIFIAATELGPQAGPSAVLSALDQALAQAEAGEPFGVVCAEPAASDLGGGGERAWRQDLLQALEQGRLRLVEYPVVNRYRGLLHLECPLRVQLAEQGPFEPAARWLPLALRSQLTARMDLQALRLAVEASARDGSERCVNLSVAALGDGEFRAELLQLLQAQPRAARLLWLEVHERAAIEQVARLREFAKLVRPLGVRLGLEHAGDQLARAGRLLEVGLDYVKIDAAVVQGAGSDPLRAQHAASIAAMLHGLSIQVMAEGVSDAQDAATLWDCGFDGVTGPWASAAGHAAQPAPPPMPPG
jgi:diguanylate cyclase (GGDEF)-like protein